MNNIKNRNEKILKKVLSLLEKGYDTDYCLRKYPDHSEQIKEHFGFFGDFENLKGIKTTYSKKQELFSKVIQEKKVSDALSGKTNGSFGKETVLPVRIRKTYLKPVLAFCLSFIFVMFAFTSTVFASEETLPGDTLYPVKITAEKMQTFLYPEARKGNLYYNFLNKRISEADRLIENEINPDDENFIFLLAQIEEQYNNCKRYGYFDEDNDSKIMEQIRQIRRHNMKYQNNNPDNQETEKNSFNNGTEPENNTDNSIDESGNFKNYEEQNKGINKKSMGNNGKN